MSFFSKIKNAIFGGPAAAAPVSGTPQSVTPTAGPSATPAASASPSPASNPAAPASTAPVTTPAAQASVSPAAPATQVDIAPILDEAVAKSGQQLNWKTSIVDLLKALNIDSSLAARKELAEELHYTGDTSDSATMNMWLHKAVMKKLAENGGKVPADLAD
ncbi:DUF3597 domain-containing protein [Rhizobium sp. CFBP 8762]|uniref:DUF3597 domain-containing protein n=1 Tax=Rhizobium sp. CFBP 8762 TaxID=2775279 RepID=UPI00177C8A94|nr:DUF3597 domain-containing protein [Rhizobium sp. CFBP 8762]MBD8555453.1 DUF3597 domain-containing protein [Rhizobium sp. CFBP 8762]